jgi:signal transduction histidine kinase
MLVLDLKTSIFIGLVLLLAMAGGFWWWSVNRARNATAKNVRQLFEAIPFGVVLVVPGGKIVYINPPARRMLTELEAGNPAPDLSRALRRFEPTDTPLVQPGMPRSGVIHQPTYLRWWTIPLTGQEKLVVLAEGGDRQRFLRQQAFVGQLMHELRTPLTALVAHTEVIASPQTPEAVRAASLQTVQNGAQRMARLVRDMLELYRVETADDFALQPLNLVLVAEDAVAQLILQAEDLGVNLNFEAQTPLPLVLGHPDRLKQVFLNLVDNAIKYCRTGDSVLVRLEKTADGVLCLVQDTGPGIPAPELPNVTKKFYRLRNTDVEGTGIGLALVSEILRQHNSSLILESATDGPDRVTGTTCRWVVPFAPAL